MKRSTIYSPGSRIPGRILFDIAQNLAASSEKLETALARFGVSDDNSNLTNKEKVKILEKEILKAGQSAVGAFEEDDELRFFGKLVLWNHEVRQRLTQPDFILQLMKISGIEERETPRVSMVSPRSANFCFFISTNSKSIFMRYHDPMGFTWLPRHSPIRSTAIYSLAAQIFRDVLTEKEVVKVLWPSVTDSFRWLRDDRSDSIEEIESLARRCVFQPDLRTTRATRLDCLPQNRWAFKDIIGLYGYAVGRLHGRSFKFLSYSNKEIRHNKLSLPASLQRFPNSARYAGYIQHAGWITRLINQVSETIKEKLSSIGFEKKEPKAFWSELCDESIYAFEATPVLGHMDLKMGNLYFDYDRNVVLFTDFDYITRIDPALEVGHCLYSLIKNCLEKNLETVENYVDCYLERYLSAFRWETGNSPVWLERSSGFGAMITLALASSGYASPTLSSIKRIAPVIRRLLERAGLV
ncbi:MAG: hypothetical protein JSV88_02615 [Candidatus Aminicenantes bacterium]|nr:MAG: hypothetical protein JSV88_02615 [Candidatus Aminicenantes bacterium]